MRTKAEILREQMAHLKARRKKIAEARRELEGHLAYIRMLNEMKSEAGSVISVAQPKEWWHPTLNKWWR